MPESSPSATPTYRFEVHGRTPEEVSTMKQVGYGEDWAFAKQGKIRRDGYFCGSCSAFKALGQGMGGHEGACLKYNFRDRDFGCCAGWYR
jgi:hypothetical protein